MGWESFTPKLVGVIPCGGEELPEGEVTRLATGIVVEKLRKGRTSTLCLPLLLRKGENEISFIENYPVIVVDGCSKKCGTCVLRKLGYIPDETVIVSDVAGKLGTTLSQETVNELSHMVAEEVAKKVDMVFHRIAEDRKTEPIES